MSLNFCDLLVLGSDLSGLMTATLLAKRGMNVLVLDDEEEGEPSANFATGLGSRAFKSLLGKLMIPDSRLQILHENKVGGQIILPRNRLDLHTSRPLFLKEIEREFPGEKEAVEELLAETDRLRENYLEEIVSFFPIVGGKERRKFVKWFRHFPQEKVLSLWERLSPTLQTCLRVHLKFLSQSPPIEPTVLQLLFFLPPEWGATFSVRGGLRGLKRLFFDKLDYFGGMVHPLSPGSQVLEDSFEIVTKGREVRAVQLSRYNFPTRCRYLIGNTNIKSLYRKIPIPFFSFLRGRKKKKVESLEPAEERSLIQYYLSSDVLPAPLKENAICIGNPSDPFFGANYLELNFQPLSRNSENGFDTVMTVSCNLKDEPQGGVREDLLKEIDLRIQRLLPFADSHLKRTLPLSPTRETSDPAMELFPSDPTAQNAGALEKIPRRRIAYSPSLFFPSLDSPLKNLVMLGPNVLDWLGMEGKMLTALRAVDLIWTRELKIRNP